MKPTSLLLAVLLLLSTPSAMAQPQSQDPASNAQVSQPADAVEVERLTRSELKALMDESRQDAANESLEPPGGLTAGQAFGFAAGVVAGAIVADLLGGGGLVTLALGLSGGAVGGWIMSD